MLYLQGFSLTNQLIQICTCKYQKKKAHKFWNQKLYTVHFTCWISLIHPPIPKCQHGAAFHDFTTQLKQNLSC